MISVVCVYNNQRILRDVLLKSLDTQTVNFELITLDNTDNKYCSAAEALNCGGEKGKGEYIMFAHQDIWLDSNSWLEEAEKVLASIPDLGIAGIHGVSEKDRDRYQRFKTSILELSGKYGLAEKPEEVQTLDECLLIVPRSVFAGIQFDEKVFDGWDCYGADYCLSVSRLGLKAYVIPIPCSHSCVRFDNRLWEYRELLKFQKRLYSKHKKNYKPIYTGFGEINWRQLRRSELVQSLGPVINKLLSDSNTILKRELSGYYTLLDLGCGHHSPIQRFNIPFTVGIELFDRSLQESKRKGIHTQYIKADIRTLEFKPKSFDAVIAIEVLEYMTKQEGYELINRMEKWARKKVVLVTPNEYFYQLDYYDNPLQEYKSYWSVDELSGLGFKVRGMAGWKRLRGDGAQIKYNPILLWRLISALTQKITYYFPTHAFELFAIKQIGHDG